MSLRQYDLTKVKVLLCDTSKQTAPETLTVERRSIYSSPHLSSCSMRAGVSNSKSWSVDVCIDDAAPSMIAVGNAPRQTA